MRIRSAFGAWWTANESHRDVRAGGDPPWATRGPFAARAPVYSGVVGAFVTVDATRRWPLEPLE